jgi:hypothetical protein
MNTECIIGSAGSGKSTLLRKRIEDGEKMLLTSTTGISAVNLGAGVTTVHSALGFYDLRSLQGAFKYGDIKRKFVTLAKKGIKTLVIDEMSMLQGEALQLIYQGACDARDLLDERASSMEQASIKDAMGKVLTGEDATGLLLVGDFCQLAPIGDRQVDGKCGVAQYAFEAPCWNGFEQNGSMTRLTKIWRQENEQFRSALNLIRAGRGVDGAIDLKSAGVQFEQCSDDQFNGITLFAVNQQVDGFNARRLAQLPGDVITIPSRRWGKERSEWKNIPQVLEVKDGALVMVLTNDSPEFRYVNGDLATFHVKTTPISQVTNDELEYFSVTFPNKDCGQVSYEVETKRNYRGPIPFVIRNNVSFNEPTEPELKLTFESSIWGRRMSQYDSSDKVWKAIYIEYIDAHAMRGEPYYEPRERGVVIGEVEYMPLRVAYASTVHKVQGLTLDKVQVDISHYWFGNPSMVYVALTRARSIEGLRIVGDVGRLARRIKTDARVRKWV